jgi:Leucine-rich repeat (LRR) protein
MNLIRKVSSDLIKVGKSITITNKLLKEIDSKDVVPSDDFRVSIPDLNFQKYLIEDYNLEFVDGTVAYGDVKEIKWIEVEMKFIKSLEGMQHFTELTELRCFGNQITSLDVSKNNALNRLECDFNQITSMDLSKNIALNYLNCGWNLLTSLDVSKNIALTTLDSWKNQLTSLDVSANTALTELYCFDNQLEALDLSNNPLLKTVRLSDNPGNWWKELEKDEE